MERPQNSERSSCKLCVVEKSLTGSEHGARGSLLRRLLSGKDISKREVGGKKGSGW